jgi:hypothetical protein
VWAAAGVGRHGTHHCGGGGAERVLVLDPAWRESEQGWMQAYARFVAGGKRATVLVWGDSC